MTGSASLDIYNPKQLVERGELIYVAMQYRVGVHGFISFGKDSEVPGNMGLLDQVLALEWIQANIRSFGGNPGDVTLMGESAGASSVALHMVSPNSCKLFHKAILQSTGLTPRWGFVDQDEAVSRAEKMALAVGCEVNKEDPSDAIACLRTRNSTELVNNEYNVADYVTNLFPFVATIDGKFLPAEPEILLKQKAFSPNKPVLLGSNANEGFWSLLYSMGNLFVKEDLSAKDMAISEDEYQNRVSEILWEYPPEVRHMIFCLLPYGNLYNLIDVSLVPDPTPGGLYLPPQVRPGVLVSLQRLGPDRGRPPLCLQH